MENLINQVSNNTIQNFFRRKSDSFTPTNQDYSHFISEENSGYISELTLLGTIEFDNADELIIIAGKWENQLTERNSKLRQYKIAKDILKSENKDASIFIFYDDNGNFRFSFITAQYSGTKRQFTTYKRYTYFVSPKLTNKTFRMQIGKCEFDSIENIQKAFSIEAVTENFYKEFKPKFDHLAKSVIGNAEEHIKQDFALLFIIRTIFLGFVQKKGWLNKDEEFIQNFWKEYKKSYYGQNLFYEEWLKPLFFEALNNPPGKKIINRSTPFSKETATALQMAPYLNGELFKEKKGYDDIELSFPDSAIEEFLDFLFSYNFTIEENTLYDQELELNPEFLGIIFERLVNKENGAVYTPRTEVDFMCRLSIVKWLEKNSSVNKKKIYHLLFDQQNSSTTITLTDKEKEEIAGLLQNVTVCDPAAGSGAFPVGMMQVLFETLTRLAPRELTEFERKKEIISRSLYGVEVKQWAVWINQLRLWLSLFIEMPDEFKNSFEPLLPNLEFKIRRGDSLVQKIGNKLFPIDKHAKNISANIKKQITELKKEKANFFYGKSKLSAKQIKQKESLIFRTIIDEEITEKKKTLRAFGQNEEGNVNIFGEVDKKEELRLQMSERVKEQLIAEIDELKAERESLRDEHPLVWNIEFAEIFYGKNGFDIIIGNPPYVQKEDIADPENKLTPKEYKEALRQSIYEEYPDYFYIKRDKSKLAKKIDGKSDLYTFFYLKTLKLLNKNGIHTFICSNSWLDVGFGAWMQEFILNNVPMQLIIDNRAKRSFSSAEVNTIISVFNAPTTTIDENFKTKFIAFKKPFEDVINTENLLLIDYAETIIKDEDFRVFPITYKELKEAGTIYENENNKKLGQGKYEGDKWGGKYLRAPDIYIKILEKVKNYYINICEIVEEINEGKATGANNFFFISKDIANKEKIEKNFLLNGLMKTKGKAFEIIKDQMVSRYFLKIPKEKTLWNNTFLHNYIITRKDIVLKNSKTLRKKSNWWYFHIKKPAQLIAPCGVGDKFFCSLNEAMAVTSNSFVEIRFNENNSTYINLVHRNLNSVWGWLQLELLGRHSLGGGMLKTDPIEYRKLKIIPFIDSKKHILERPIFSIWQELGFDPSKPIREQEPNPLPDRKELDDIIFNAIGLTEDERKEVYWATAELVQNRLNKAKSV